MTRSTRVPVEVGQIRDVSTAADRREKVQRLAKVTLIENWASNGFAWIESLDGKRPRTKLLKDLERCPVVKP